MNTTLIINQVGTSFLDSFTSSSVCSLFITTICTNALKISNSYCRCGQATNSITSAIFNTRPSTRSSLFANQELAPLAGYSLNSIVFLTLPMSEFPQYANQYIVFETALDNTLTTYFANSTNVNTLLKTLKNINTLSFTGSTYGGYKTAYLVTDDSSSSSSSSTPSPYDYYGLGWQVWIAIAIVIAFMLLCCIGFVCFRICTHDPYHYYHAYGGLSEPPVNTQAHAVALAEEGPEHEILEAVVAEDHLVGGDGGEGGLSMTMITAIGPDGQPLPPHEQPHHTSLHTMYDVYPPNPHLPPDDPANMQYQQEYQRQQQYQQYQQQQRQQQQQMAAYAHHTKSFYGGNTNNNNAAPIAGSYYYYPPGPAGATPGASPIPVGAYPGYGYPAPLTPGYIQQQQQQQGPPQPYTSMYYPAAQPPPFPGMNHQTSFYAGGGVGGYPPSTASSVSYPTTGTSQYNILPQPPHSSISSNHTTATATIVGGVPLTAVTTPTITANALHSQSVYNALNMNTANAPVPPTATAAASVSTTHTSRDSTHQRPSPKRSIEDEFEDDDDDGSGGNELPTRNGVVSASADGMSDVSSLTYPTMTTTATRSLAPPSVVATPTGPAVTVAPGGTAAERYARYARKASQQIHQQLQQQQPPQDGVELQQQQQQQVRRPSNPQTQL